MSCGCAFVTKAEVIEKAHQVMARLDGPNSLVPRTHTLQPQQICLGAVKFRSVCHHKPLESTELGGQHKWDACGPMIGAQRT